MTKVEIDTFIETMEEFNDVWTPEQVLEVYGDKTLEEALTDRKSAIFSLADIIGNVLNR